MGTATPLGDGRWRARETSGSGPDRLRASATGATRREARALAQNRLEKKNRESGLERHDMTLGAFLSRWFAHMRAGHASGHTVDSYESIARVHIPERLRRKQLRDVTPMDVQRVIDDRIRSGAAEESARKQYNMMNSAFHMAVAWRLALVNPCDDARSPGRRHREMTALDEEQTAALLRATAGPMYAPTLVAATTGLRRGELLALDWRCVDIARGTLRIRRVVEEAAGVLRVRDYPKTDGSRRTIVLMQATTAALKAHKSEQARQRLAALDWRDGGLVFPNKRGDIWRPTSFSRRWGDMDAVKDMRLSLGKHLRFHDMRHTHATQLLRAGVPVDAVAKRLGHKSPTITLATYAHVLPDADAAAVASLESSLGDRLSQDCGKSAGK